MRWLELLKDYDINIFYQPSKANVVADAFNSLFIGSIIHVEEEKRDLGKDVQDLHAWESD